MAPSLTRSPLDPDLYMNGMPLELLEYLRSNHPCLRVELDDPRQLDFVWVLTRYDDVVAVLRDEIRFTVTEGVTVNRFSMSSTVSGGKPSLLTMGRDDHRRVRPALGATFTPRTIKVFAASYREMVRKVIEAAVAKGTFEAVEDLSFRLPMHAICTLLGIPAEDHDLVRKWGDAQAAPLDPDVAPSPEFVVESINNLWEYAAALLEKRRADPQDDVISRLIPPLDTTAISLDEYLGIVSLLVIAGNETTRNNISHSIKTLIDYPEVWFALADADDNLWGTAVEELTRWASPVIQFRRTATQDVTMHGQQIRSGDPVVFMLNAANFDPRVFDMPEKFDMRRSPNPHVAFGTGAHFCLGSHLAKIETRIVLEELRQRVRRIEAAGSIEYQRATHVRGVKRLPISVDA